MNSKPLSRLAAIVPFLMTGSLLAAEPVIPPPAVTGQQPDFSPPPVPEFMLRKPAKPLTLDEMKQQADEAAKRAREERERHSKSATSAKPAEVPSKPDTPKK